jgi:hypothetical protein
VHFAYSTNSTESTDGTHAMVRGVFFALFLDCILVCILLLVIGIILVWIGSTLKLCWITLLFLGTHWLIIAIKVLLVLLFSIFSLIKVLSIA